MIHKIACLSMLLSASVASAHDPREQPVFSDSPEQGADVAPAPAKAPAAAPKSEKGKYKHAAALAAKTGRPEAEIRALRDGGMGWGEIAKKFGTTMGEVNGKGRGKAKGKGKLKNAD